MNKKGFSILELSIVIICISLFIGMSLRLIVLLNVSKRLNTEYKLRRISLALENYVTIHNSLPCPSNIKLKLTEESYGTESLDSSNDCKIGDGLFKYNNIYVGGVPIKELDLKINDSIDAWGNKIIYSVYDKVTEKYTNTNTNFCINFTGKNGNHSTVKNLYYAIISNGKNMFGAIPQNSSTNIRMNYSYSGRPELANIFSASNFLSNSDECLNGISENDKNFDDIIEFGIYNQNLVKKINSEY